MKILKKILIISGSVVLAISIVIFLWFCYYTSKRRKWDQQQAERQQKINDERLTELRQNGAHGYYCFWYIVGKIRTAQINERWVPLNANVSALNPALVQTKIKFNMIDEDSYKIVYTLGERETELTGNLDEELQDVNIKMIVRKGPTATNSVMQTLKDIHYLFEVQKY